MTLNRLSKKQIPLPVNLFPYQYDFLAQQIQIIHMANASRQTKNLAIKKKQKKKKKHSTLTLNAINNCKTSINTETDSHLFDASLHITFPLETSSKMLFHSVWHCVLSKTKKLLFSQYQSTWPLHLIDCYKFKLINTYTVKPFLFCRLGSSRAQKLTSVCLQLIFFPYVQFNCKFQKKNKIYFKLHNLERGKIRCRNPF